MKRAHHHRLLKPTAFAVALSATLGLMSPTWAAGPPGAQFQLNPPGTAAGAPAIGRSGHGEFVASWGVSGGGLVARLFAADGTPLGEPFTVKPVDGQFPGELHAAMNSAGAFAVSWQQRAADGSQRIIARSYAVGGTPRAEVVAAEIRGLSYLGSDVAIDDDGDLVLAWREVRDVAIGIPLTPYSSIGLGSSVVKARRFRADGSAIGGTARLSTSFTDPVPVLGIFDTVPPAVASDADGNSVVVWSTRDGLGPNGVFGRALSAGGVPLGIAFRVDARASEGAYGPSIAMDDDGDFLVSWTGLHRTGGNSFSGYDVLARRYTARRFGGPVIAVGDFVSTGGRANVDMNASGQAVVSWAGTSSNGCCVPPLLIVQPLDRDGSRIGGNLIVSDRFTSGSDVGIDDNGGFVIGWGSVGESPNVANARLYPPQ